MTPEMALRLGRAVAYHFRGKHKSGRGRIVIGKDTRLSGYMFETALAAGICSMGADVMLCGPLPTPGIAFITSSMRADAGVVICARTTRIRTTASRSSPPTASSCPTRSRRGSRS